jgi:glycosyltransferase 2 family protein
MSTRTWWRWVRPLVGAAILALLLWRLGAGPFLDGVRTIDAMSLSAAAAITALTTVCCAWRWSIVARGLGVSVPLRTAVAAYYRSQFLNSTLPGGVLGDVERGIRHGRDVGNTGRALRAVAWDRVAGQVVQVVVATGLLLTLPSPIRSSMPIVALALVAAASGMVLLSWAVPRGGPSLWARALRAMASDLRTGLFARRAWPAVVLASVLAAAGHTLIFLIAARTAGSDASVAQLLPLALIVLLAMSVPTNIAGWGPREGVAAWAFGAAGLGAAQGVSTAVVYGVMALVASLPGAVVVVATWLRDGRRSRHVAREMEWSPEPGPPRLAVTKGAARG